MKNAIKYIMLCAALVGIIYLAYAGYNYLKQSYQPKSEASVQNQADNLQKASDFTVSNKAGNKVNLTDNFGKPVIVNFWATWCGPCKSEMPGFEKVYEKYKDDISFMMVNMTDGQRDTVDRVNEFIKQNGYTFPVYYDNEYSAARAYSVKSIPTTLFINEKGEIVYTHIGAADSKMLLEYAEKLSAAANQ